MSWLCYRRDHIECSTAEEGVGLIKGHTKGDTTNDALHSGSSFLVMLPPPQIDHHPGKTPVAYIYEYFVLEVLLHARELSLPPEQHSDDGEESTLLGQEEDDDDAQSCLSLSGTSPFMSSCMSGSGSEG